MPKACTHLLRSREALKVLTKVFGRAAHTPHNPDFFDEYA